MTQDDEQKRSPQRVLYRRAPAPAEDHQPRKAEMEEEVDMPKASRATVRRAFFRLFKPQQGRG